MTLPSHCEQCGALLQGGATRHMKTCWWYPLSYIGIMEQSPFTLESLIEVFGDQAYHKGCRMAVEALRAGDREACRQISAAVLVLVARGYHKKPEVKTEDKKPE